MCYISVSRDLVESGGSKEPEGDGKSSEEDRPGVREGGAVRRQEVIPRQQCPSRVLVLKSSSPEVPGAAPFCGHAHPSPEL